MRYRKRPVEVEAIQFAKPYHRVEEFCRTIRWIKGANGQIVWALIPTLEGDMRAEVGDWIIRGVQGEFYPCKPDIFEGTYERADSMTAPATITETLVEVLRLHPYVPTALRGVSRCGCGEQMHGMQHDHQRHLADVLLPVLAEVWDEGYAAFAGQFLKPMDEAGQRPKAENPYRAGEQA